MGGKPVSRSNSISFLTAFAFPCVTGVVTGTAIFWTSGLESRAVREGTSMFLTGLFVAAMVDLWARNSSRRWSVWRFGAIYFVGLVILRVISQSIFQ
jgi:hypothetical protein